MVIPIKEEPDFKVFVTTYDMEIEDDHVVIIEPEASFQEPDVPIAVIIIMARLSSVSIFIRYEDKWWHARPNRTHGKNFAYTLWAEEDNENTTKQLNNLFVEAMNTEDI